MLGAKERLGKKNKERAAFTDDGFAMGIAYILKLTDQEGAFAALHWFKSVAAHFAHGRKEIEDQRNNTKLMKDEKLRQAQELTLKRLQVNQQEFDLLRFGIVSAQIFFRSRSEWEGVEPAGQGRRRPRRRQRRRPTRVVAADSRPPQRQHLRHHRRRSRQLTTTRGEVHRRRRRRHRRHHRRRQGGRAPRSDVASRWSTRSSLSVRACARARPILLERWKGTGR